MVKCFLCFFVDLEVVVVVVASVVVVVVVLDVVVDVDDEEDVEEDDEAALVSQRHRQIARSPSVSCPTLMSFSLLVL